MTKLCEIHGKPLHMVGDQLLCAKCLAQVSSPALHVAQAFKQKAANLLIEGRLKESGIPFEFIGATLKGMRSPQGDAPQIERARRIQAAMINYVGNFDVTRASRPGLLVVGVPGSGKTHMACAMCAELILAGFSAKYVSMPSMTTAIRASYRSQEGVQPFIESLIAVDFLVIDEIDLHGTSDNDYNILYEIINGRYEAGKRPTMALSNRDLAHLRNDLDERIISRLLGAGREIQMVWPSFRVAPNNGARP